MRRIIVIIAALLLSNAVFSLQVPSRPSNYINDYAQVLSPTEQNTLNAQLQQFEKKTSNQIVVAIFPDLKNDALDDFTNRLEEQWKIGQKHKDNGILIVVFVKQHLIRIEVGYGLEGTVTDTMAGLIIRNTLAPNFKKGNYNAGLQQAINQLMDLTRNATPPEKTVAPADHTVAIMIAIAIAACAFCAAFFLLPNPNKMNDQTPFPVSTQPQKKITLQPESKRKRNIGQIILSILWFILSLLSNNRGGGGGRSGGGGADGKW